MNLRALKYFVAIADAGSLTAAAEAIAIAQPALSRQMHELERDLGTQLLQRTPRGVMLTKAGATLYASAQRMLAEAQMVRKQLGGAQFAASGAIRLGASPTLARVLIPGVFERCYQTLSGVQLTVREAFTPVLLDWLERGFIDLALVTAVDAAAGRHIATQSLLGEPFVLVRQGARSKDTVIPVTQLPKIPLLMTSLHRSLIEHDLNPLGLRLNVIAEIDSVDCIRELVSNGTGEWSTLMPVSVFKLPYIDKRISFSEVSGVQLNRQLLMATRIEREESAAVSVLKDLIQAQVVRLTSEGMFSLRLPL